MMHPSHGKIDLQGLKARLDPRHGCCALVAIKARAECKTRLAAELAADARIALVRSMLAHVLHALRAAQTVRQIIVLSPERDQVPADVPVLADRGVGLNEALVEARGALLELGARALLVLPADLPLVAPAEIDRLVRAGRQGFALAPDARGTGTNALFLRGAQPFRFQFGPDSRRGHLAEAARAGLRPRVLRAPGLALDVDLPADLAAANMGACACLHRA